MSETEGKLPVSVFFITKDCGRWFERVLQPLAGFAEIVVLDSGSRDDTLEIAERHGARIYHRDFRGFGEQKQAALELCTQPWVLNLDGDEVIDDVLRDAIARLVRLDDPSVVGGRVRIRDWFIGKLASKATRPIRRVRLFRRERGRFLARDRVHESVQLDMAGDRVVDLSGWIEHYGVESVALRVEKINRYSTYRADQDLARGKEPSPLKLFTIFPLRFLKSYVLRRGFLSGRRGLIQSVGSAYYALLIEAKKFETRELERSGGARSDDVSPRIRQDEPEGTQGERR
ncbi:glycosyltransferase family 2 protein [Guyparkeria sp. TX1]|uniref:glycosyltransferase family 2 protein n=1 Tax=Guyparkeria sp. TX1 TaxID=3115001 RepID=UPI0039778AFC